MKVMVRETEGYSEDMLESMVLRTSFPSSFFEQLTCVRGVCFAAGPDSTQLARNFAAGRLNLGIFSVSREAITPKAWRELSRVLLLPQTEFSRVGILLPDLDRVPTEVQEQIAQVMLATDKLRWFPTASDHRKLLPALQKALVVYLGLGSNNRMQVLIQPGQMLGIDKGSLKRGPRPNLN